MPVIKRFERNNQLNHIDKITITTPGSIIDSLEKEVIKNENAKTNNESFIQKWKENFKSIFQLNK